MLLDIELNYSMTTMPPHMILILADDLSGAAELAGIAASRGLKAEVQMKVVTQCSADVIAIDTQTRSLLPETAAAKIASVYEQVARLRPAFIYKKTDSVFRGNVRAELEALAQAAGRNRIIFVPANPGKGRRIRDGKYFVHERPLNQTVFASDPDHPQRFADVVQALGEVGTCALRSIRVHETSPPHGLIIPDVTSQMDLSKRAAEVDGLTLPAGAAEFFAAFLERVCEQRTIAQRPTLQTTSSGPALFVCGSPAAWHQGIQQQAERHGVSVLSIGATDRRVSEALVSLRASGAVMIALGQPDRQDKEIATGCKPFTLLEPLIDAAVEIMNQGDIRQVFVEGGATATALIERMNWNRFEVVPFDLLGVGCLKPSQAGETPLVFAKPGSYSWPEGVWKLISTQESIS